MFEAYSIGVKISLVNHANAGLLALSRAFIKTDGDAKRLEKRIKGIQSSLLTGGLLVGAGVAMASMFEPAIKSAVRYEQQLNKLKALNLGLAQTSGLTRQADSLARSVRGTSRTDALRLVTETQAITGNVQHTQELVPLLARMRYGLNTYMGEGKGDAAESQFRDVVKVMELRGLMRNFSQDNARTMMDLFTRTFIASGGQVKPSDFLAMMKTAGVAGKSVSNDFLFALGHMMQESGGARTGTALMSGYQNLVAGRTTQQVAELLHSMGMLQPGAIKYGNDGHITKLAPGALVQSQLLQSNPLDYLNQVILPKMAAHGIDINNASQVLPKLNQMLSNRRASAMFSQMYLDRQVLGNYIAQAKNAKGVDALYAQSGASTQGNLNDLTAKYDSLLTNLGQAALPLVNLALQKLIPLVQNLATWITNNKGKTKLLVEGFIGLAAAMAFNGTLLILKGAFVALGTVLQFAAIGGPVGIYRLAVAIGVWGKAILFSQVGGAGGILGIGKSLTSVAGGLGLLTQAAGLFMAAYAGWKAGGWLSGLMDSSVQQSTGNKSATWGGALFDYLHPFDAKTGKHAFSWGHLAHWVVANDPNALMGQSIRQSDQAEAGYERSRYVAHRTRGQTLQVHSTVHLDGRAVAKAVTTHQVNAATQPQTGTSGFDFSQHPQPIGIGGSL